MTKRTLAVVSLLWGLFEAVVFFIIPDVLLTWIAARYGTRRALVASVWAVGGAVVGGLAAYAWGAVSAGSAFGFMERLPGIDGQMIAAVGASVDADGPGALLSGPLRGEPYKLYATAAGVSGTSPLALALWTVPGRLWRFVGLTVLFGTIRTGLQRATGRSLERPLVALWAMFWLFVYALFWSR